jgi:hypothetical protein
MGCSNSERPSDFPALVPFSVTVLNNDKPEQNVSITFTSTIAQAFSPSGSTDSSGKAVIYTLQGNYMQKGIPLGDYIVIFDKPPKVEGTKTPEELANMEVAELEAYTEDLVAKEAKLPRIVPPILTSPDTSPVKISIGESVKELSIDLAEYKGK